MPNASQAEIYFIAAMFVLIIVISGTATYFFFHTYKKEKAGREKRMEKQNSNSKR